jgi:hypothetical protein
MKPALSIFLFFVVLPAFSQVKFPNDTTMAWKLLKERGEVYFSFEASLPEIRYLSSTISIDSYSDGKAYAYANHEEFKTFLQESIEFIIYSPPGEWHKEDTTVKPALKSTGNYYPDYTEYMGIMLGWQQEYPGICEFIEAGTSVEGRSIAFIKITGDNPGSAPKPRFMYSSTMHGDETVGFILMLRLIDYLLTRYPDDEQVAFLLDNLEIWINPLANPDGAYFGGDGNSIISPKRNNTNNIDLNRNFPRPDNPFYDRLEPEAAAMVELMESKQFILSANLHGGTEVMNYPWDIWKRGHPDSTWFEYICREYADTAMLYSPPDYMTFLGGVTNGYDWYSITGGRQDYVTYFTGGREVTMEISNIKHPPASSLQNYWEYNRRSLLSYMEQAIFGIRGNISDSVTGEKLRAEITLARDCDSSHVWSDSISGWYFRLLEKGLYDLMVSADGYHTRVIDGVEVNNREATMLDIALVPLEDETDYYQLTLMVEPPEAGTVTGEGYYPEKCDITVTATAFDGYLFDFWLLEEEITGYQSTFVYTMPASDVSLTAVFQDVTGTGLIDRSYDPVTIYPVPSGGIMHIRIEQAGQSLAELSLLDVSGRRVILIYSGLIGSGPAYFELDAGNLVSGVYIINFKSGRYSTNRRVVIAP